MNYDELTNEQLDISCAEACGYRMVEYPYAFPSLEMIKSRFTPEVFATIAAWDYEPIPHPSTDYAAAHALLDKLSDARMDISISIPWNGPTIAISVRNKDGYGVEVTEAESFFRAVSIVFLKTREGAK